MDTTEVRELLVLVLRKILAHPTLSPIHPERCSDEAEEECRHKTEVRSQPPSGIASES